MRTVSFYKQAFRIETHPYTIKDFENSPFVLDEIKKKGLLINTL